MPLRMYYNYLASTASYPKEYPVERITHSAAYQEHDTNTHICKRQFMCGKRLSRYSHKRSDEHTQAQYQRSRPDEQSDNKQQRAHSFYGNNKY